MQVAARGGDRGVPEGLLHQADGSTAVEAVAGVGMAQSVGRNLSGEPRPLGGGFHDAVHGALVE